MMGHPSRRASNRLSRLRRMSRWVKAYGKQMAACIISLAAVAHAIGEFVQLAKSIGLMT
jgi:hypothetical protein